MFVGSCLLVRVFLFCLSVRVRWLAFSGLCLFILVLWFVIAVSGLLNHGCWFAFVGSTWLVRLGGLTLGCCCCLDLYLLTAIVGPCSFS